jgi:predicted PurR-regulated permease PerM
MHDESAPAGDQETPKSPRMTFAAQELRLISALVILIGIGLFLALPFVLSIGSVVFLPIVTALILTILLSPMADHLSGWGLPNALASLAALIVFMMVVILALSLVMQPAVTLFDQVPMMANKVGEHFTRWRNEFSWIAVANERLADLIGGSRDREVVVATPSVLQQLAIATPSVILKTLLTLLMTYFMLEARIRLRHRLLFDRASFGSSVKAARVMREVQDRVSAYILTVGWINACVGIVVTAGAWALGLEAPIMWGGLAAILNFVPYIGPLVMTALLALFGIGTADTVLLGLVPAFFYIGLHAIESNVITPSILGARFTMNPVMILIALSYFSWIWGIFGALLSVPILLTLTAFFDHVGKPNVIGFIFGEPLFQSNFFGTEPDEETTEKAA